MSIVFIISAPSGSGKSTLVKRLLEAVPELLFSISYTTRKPRGTEREDGESYRFVSRQTFEAMIEKDEFLEHAQVFGNYYGTHRSILDSAVAQGRDLASVLQENNVALMRGHGFVAAARSLIEVVRMSVYTPRNARVQYRAMQMGGVKPLSRGEIEARNAGYKPYSPETWRAWEYWATRAGCAQLLTSSAGRRCGPGR